MYQRTALAIAIILAGPSCAVASTATINFHSSTTTWLDAYSRAANIPPLRKSPRPELRVWILDGKSGRVVGYSVSETVAVACQTHQSTVGDTVTIEPANCRPVSHPHRMRAALRQLNDLYALDGKELDCGVMDGDLVYIEGVFRRHRFALWADNPNLCRDPASGLITKVLSLL